MTSPHWIRRGIHGLQVLSPALAAVAARELFLRPQRPVYRRDQEALLASASRDSVSDLAIYRWGKGAPRVLALHGWQGHAGHWAPFMETLLRLGGEVVALDGPAHGSSPGTHANPFSFTDALMQVDRVFGPFDAGIGHSMGGAATALAVTRGLRVKRAVLLAAPARLDWVLKATAEQLGLSSSTTKLFLQEVECSVGVPISRGDIGTAVRNASIPALIVHDRRDREISFNHANHFANNWPRCELVPTEGLGHRRAMRDSSVHQRVFEFLR
ncbi:MAG: alpha/beta fold hydrolase [Myxococcota bacterium]